MSDALRNATEAVQAKVAARLVRNAFGVLTDDQIIQLCNALDGMSAATMIRSVMAVITPEPRRAGHRLQNFTGGVPLDAGAAAIIARLGLGSAPDEPQAIVERIAPPGQAADLLRRAQEFLATDTGQMLVRFALTVALPMLLEIIRQTLDTAGVTGPLRDAITALLANRAVAALPGADTEPTASTPSPSGSPTAFPLSTTSGMPDPTET